MNTLTGSEKQISWAESIRTKILAEEVADEKKVAFKNFLANKVLLPVFFLRLLEMHLFLNLIESNFAPCLFDLSK